MSRKGKITAWHDDKGYGFITPETFEKPVFVHVKAFKPREPRPKLNDIVSFAVASDARGRRYANQARLLRGGASRSRRASSAAVTRPLPFAFLACIVLAVLFGRLPFGVLAVYLAVSGITFGIYALDKSAARRGSWRTRENTLHFLALSGGWPGALLAQHRLRHKSRKPAFRVWFWITASVNSMVLIWLITPPGTRTLQSLMQAASMFNG